MSATPLAERHCLPCEGGVAPLSGSEIAPLLRQLDGWVLESAADHEQLVKRYKFENFVAAVDFVNRITPIAEAEGHHPDLLVGWGAVTVMLWTHAAGGLTENDFVLAARIDALS